MVKPNCLGLECNRIFAFYLKIPNCMYVTTIFCIFQRETHQSLALMLPFEISIVVTILIQNWQIKDQLHLSEPRCNMYKKYY